MASSKNSAWLKLGVTMLTRGQGRPSCIVCGSCRLPSIHGQPVLPGKGGGSSLSVGQSMRASPQVEQNEVPACEGYQPQCSTTRSKTRESPCRDNNAATASFTRWTPTLRMQWARGAVQAPEQSSSPVSGWSTRWGTPQGPNRVGEL